MRQAAKYNGVGTQKGETRSLDSSAEDDKDRIAKGKKKKSQTR